MTETGTNGVEGQAAGDTSGADGKTSAPVKTDGKTDLATLPADVQTLISSLREEAKGYRLEKENLEVKVNDLTEEVETAQSASRTLSESAAKAARALTLRNLRDKYNLDERAEKFLTAQSDEELEKQAEDLSVFASPKEKAQDDAGAAGGLRVADPAQQGTETVDEDAARAAAFFGGK